MPTVTMTIEEYLQLVEATNVKLKARPASPREVAVAKRKGKKDPKMAKALKRANEIGRKKNGGYKKGYSQAKIMSLAHKLRRKM